MLPFLASLSRRIFLCTIVSIYTYFGVYYCFDYSNSGHRCRYEFLGDFEPLSLYHMFLLDKFAQVSSIRDARHFVAYTPDTGRGFFRRIVPCGFKLIEQSGADLGARLANISRGLFEKGFKKVIMLDSDTPTLPLFYICLLYTSPSP